MVPIVKSLPSYIKDTNHALEIFPNNEGLQVLRLFFDQRTIYEPSSETLLRLAELVLTLNCFSFADNPYKQVNGVAIGTKMGPTYESFRRLHRKPIFQPM